MKTLLTLALLSLAFFSFGQQKQKCCTSTPLKPVEVEKTTDLPQIENFNGTYQFRVPEGDSFSFTYALLEHIESQRKTDQDVILDLGNGRSVFIVASNTVQSNGFVPFDSPYMIIQ